MDLQSQIESILFVASKPLSFKTIAKALGESEAEVAAAVEDLKSKYNHEQSGIHILAIDDEIQMATNPAHTEVIDQFIKREVTEELTKAQLETLTVIAYRGPITRPELEQIRGVNCALILRNLLVRGLVEEREDPASILPRYALSFEALRHLGVDSVTELPEYGALHAHEHVEATLAPQHLSTPAP
ncbi:MAG: SMC-Scp complex subunit ScpB [Patescibacteria group bacterium]